MKINDQQFGRPQILYKAVKAQIEATPNPQPGMIAFATDTNQIGIYTGGGWQWGTGVGDMLKAIYDTDNDGVVDAAESVDWDGVQNKPSTYPPSSHNHDDRYYTEDELNTSGGGGQVHWNNVTNKPSSYPPSSHQHAASDVTSGVFDPARIPNLDAGKITSGTLSTDRFSAWSDLQAENRIGLITGRIPDAGVIRHQSFADQNITEDFTSSSIPSGWAWAGSPFITPPTLGVYNGTIFYVSGSTSSRAFLHKTAVPIQVKYVMAPYMMANSDCYIGIRLDDGTDNNYVESVAKVSSATRAWTVAIRWRLSGGAVNETLQSNMPSPFLPFTSLCLFVDGTRWSNWRAFPVLFSLHGLHFQSGTIPTGLTWTPARLGIVIQFGAWTWEQFGVDYVNF